MSFSNLRDTIAFKRPLTRTAAVYFLGNINSVPNYRSREVLREENTFESI